MGGAVNSTGGRAIHDSTSARLGGAADSGNRAAARTRGPRRSESGRRHCGGGCRPPIVRKRTSSGMAIASRRKRWHSRASSRASWWPNCCREGATSPASSARSWARAAMSMPWCPHRRLTPPRTMPDFAARVKAIAADPNYSNVSVVVEPFGQLKAPVPVDLVWTSQNYHDLHNLPGVDVGSVQSTRFRRV